MALMLGSITYEPIPIFDVGPLRLSLHGLFAGLGFAAGAYLMIREAGKRGFDQVKITSVLTWALVGAILGARLFTVPAHLGDPGYGLDDVFNPSGFYSIMGGFAGGILVGVLRMRILGMAPLVHLDLASYGLALGTVVGRIGDLLIVEHSGGRPGSSSATWSSPATTWPRSTIGSKRFAPGSVSAAPTTMPRSTTCSERPSCWGCSISPPGS